MGYKVRKIQRFHKSLEQTLSALDGGGPFQTIFDVGANIGQTAQRFNALFPHAHVYSFEPCRETYETLSKNVEPYKNIRTFRLGLGASNKPQTMGLRKANYTNSILKNSTAIGEYVPGNVYQAIGVEEVRISTLKSFCEDANISQVDLLKIDTQGYEDRVLGGAGDLLTPALIRAIYLEVLFIPHYQDQAEFDELYGMLRNRGYRMYAMYDICADESNGYKWANALFVDKNIKIL